MIEVIDDYIEYMNRTVKKSDVGDRVHTKSEVIQYLNELYDAVESCPQAVLSYIKNERDKFCDQYSYCPTCCTKFQIKHYREPRPYQEGYAYEDMYYEYCPICSKKREDLL